MGWILRVGAANAGPRAQAAARTFVRCDGARDADRNIVRLTISPGMNGFAGATGAASACQTRLAWQQVLSTLVGFD